MFLYFGVFIYVKYRIYSMIQTVKGYMDYVNCIYINSDKLLYDYFMIFYKSREQHITNSISASPFKLCIPKVNPHLNYSI